MSIPTRKRNTPSDFWQRLIPSGECLEWSGSRFPTGYGRMSWQGKLVYTHRLAWTLAVGPIPTGMQVCHHCDNPPCARLDHLFLGTPLDNMQDRDAKGRGHSGTAVLTEPQILEARRLHRQGIAVKKIAETLGVTEGSLYPAVRGKTWKKLPGAGTHQWHMPLYFQWLRAQADVLRRRLREGESNEEVARSVGISKSTLHRIVSGRHQRKAS